MHCKTMLGVAAAVAVIAGLHASMLATGNGDALVLEETQFAPAVLDADDDLAISLRRQAELAVAQLQARSGRD
jgi:hypothetical protein